jgi:hypothetical protein
VRSQVEKAGNIQPRRAKNWNEGLAKDLRDPAFVKEFIQAALEEGLPIQVVLGKIIRAFGQPD